MTAQRRRGPARRLVTAAVLALIFATTACTTVAPLSPAAPGDDFFSGRMALRVDATERQQARSITAMFDLQGGPTHGAIALSTSLGSMLARADWSPALVELVTPRGTSRFADLDQLTRDVLGESVPIEAWFDWLRGRPWPGAPSTAHPGGNGFEQLGWRVDTGRFSDGNLQATRPQPPPQVTIRIQLDPS